MGNIIILSKIKLAASDANAKDDTRRNNNIKSFASKVLLLSHDCDCKLSSIIRYIQGHYFRRFAIASKL